VRERLPAWREGDAKGTIPAFIDHDDEEREYACPGASFTDPDAEPIGETARRFGWTMVSMRRDWYRVFDG
jgi:hypothetical protein